MFKEGFIFDHVCLFVCLLSKENILSCLLCRTFVVGPFSLAAAEIVSKSLSLARPKRAGEGGGQNAKEIGGRDRGGSALDKLFPTVTVF